jgi:hypothetical protein
MYVCRDPACRYEKRGPCQAGCCAAAVATEGHVPFSPRESGAGREEVRSKGPLAPHQRELLLGCSDSECSCWMDGFFVVFSAGWWRCDRYLHRLTLTQHLISSPIMLALSHHPAVSRRPAPRAGGMFRPPNPHPVPTPVPKLRLVVVYRRPIRPLLPYVVV